MFNDLQAHKIIGGSTNAEPPLYSRPGDWLPLPTVTEADEKIVALVAVYDAYLNRCEVTISGDYTVNWGDGVVEDFQSGDTAIHDYEWSSTPASSITAYGYRQRILTITAQAGFQLDTVELNRSSFLDLSASLPNTNSITISNLPEAQILTIVNAPVLANFEAYNIDGLQQLSAINIHSLSNFNSFNWPYSLRQVFISGASSITTLSGVMEDCSSLKSAEIRDLNSLTNSIDTTFLLNSYWLIDLKLTGLTQLTNEGMYAILQALSSGNKNANIVLEDLNSINDLDYGIPQTGDLQEGSLTLTGLTNLTTLDYAFSQTKYKAIKLSGLDNVTSAEQTFSACYYLRNIELIGTQNIENWYYCFEYCTSLVSAILDTSGGINLSGMFYGCNSLVSVPLYDTSNAVDMSAMFEDCAALAHLPNFDTTSCDYLGWFAQGCPALRIFPSIDTSNCMYIDNLVDSCSGLKIIPSLDMSNISTTAFTFSLSSLSLTNVSMYGIFFDITLAYNMLTRPAILEIFNNLSSVPAPGKTINITGNPGVPDLTEADIEIATNQGWTVSY